MPSCARLLRSLFLLVSLGFVYICGIAVYGISLHAAAPADIAVVLGNEVYPDGTVSPRLAARLDCAIALYRSGLVPRILASGGIEAGGVDEAAAMARYLAAHGVDGKGILTDSLGRNTMATAVNTQALMQANHWQSAIAVSQYFHLPRTLLAFHKVGIDHVAAGHPDYFEWRDAFALVREGVGLPVYWMDSVAGRK